MRKFVIIFVGVCLLLQMFAPGLIFPIKIARAATLSTDMFPSSLAGLSLWDTSTQIGSPCYSQAQEFVSAIYSNQAGTKQLGCSLSKFSSAATAKSTAESCLAMVRQQYAQADWHPVENTTVSGYDTIVVMVDVPSEDAYMAALYTFVDDYLVAMVIASTGRVSESEIKDASAVLVSKLPQKPSKKSDGQICQEDDECQSDFCGYASESNKKICCAETETKLCCITQEDCGSVYYCQNYSCYERKGEGESCSNDYQCRSEFCDNGECKYKEVEEKKKDDGASCIYHFECKSENCSNNICCQIGKDCCRTDQDCGWKGEFWKCQNYICLEDLEAKQAHEAEERAAAERYRRGTDGVCDYDEPCTTQDCMATARCVIEEACSWGGDVRIAAGCLASIASELNIVAKVADIIQGIGCDIIVNFLAGIIEQDINKVAAAAIGIIYTAIDIVMLKIGTVVKLLIKVVQCIDGYFGLSRWFLVNVVYAIVNAASAVAQQGAAAIGLGSPAGLIVTDESGRQVGVDEQGKLHEDISGGFYIEFPRADIKMVILTETKGKDFAVETLAEEAGKIDLKIARCDKGEKEVIEYNDIEQWTGTKTELSFGSKVGASVKDMEVTSAAGEKRIEKADQVTKEKIEVPAKYRIGFWSKLKRFAASKIFLFILVALGVILILAGIYVTSRYRKR